MFKGSIPALITPFKNGKVDFSSYEKIIEWSIAEGSHGFVPYGTTGESPTLSHEEHKNIVEELIRLMKTNKFKNKNNDFFLNIRFKIRDLRSKVLKLKYGNIKFSFFDKKEILKTFEILKDLEPKYSDLKLNFIKKDIIQIKRSG